jgi:hypothetical protein
MPPGAIGAAATSALMADRAMMNFMVGRIGAFNSLKNLISLGPGPPMIRRKDVSEAHSQWNN